MTDPLDFEIPAGIWLSANDRRHWRDKARANRALRLLGKTTAQQAKLRDLGPSLVVAHIGYPTGRKADPNNAADTTKPLIDGLVDAGVWPDDDSTYVIGPLHVRAPNHGRTGIHTVRLTFQPQENIQ